MLKRMCRTRLCFSNGCIRVVVSFRRLNLFRFRSSWFRSCWWRVYCRLVLLGKPRQVILDDAHALRSFLVATVKEMTGACEVDTTTSFADLGVDSLHIILLVHKIRDEMMLTVQQLDETTLYDSKYSTIDGLTTYCLQVGQQSVVAQSVACPTPQSTSCFVLAILKLPPASWDKVCVRRTAIIRNCNGNSNAKWQRQQKSHRPIAAPLTSCMRNSSNSLTQ